VSSHRRSSLLKATTSSLAKRCENVTENVEVDDGRRQASGASNLAASLTSRINKLVKGGSKPAAAAAATTSLMTNSKRLSLDASARPPRTGWTSGVTSRSRDRHGGRTELSQSTSVGQGQGHGVASSARGVRGAGRGQTSTAAVQGPRAPRPANLVKSSSTMSLRTEANKKTPVVKKSVR